MSKERLMAEGVNEVATEQAIGDTPFSLSAWIEGRAQATRTVRIYGSLGLYGEREQLGYDLEAARAEKDTGRVAELKKRIDDLTVEMQEDYMDFKLQGLTHSRRQELLEELDASSVEDPVELSMMMLTAYVVEPAGVSPQSLMGLAEWDPQQANELVKAMNQLNENVPNIGATRPF